MRQARKQTAWYTAFELDGLRRFVIERVLYHEVGHHIELCTKRWSGRCPKKGEDFAHQYAAHFSATAAGVVLSIDESA